LERERPQAAENDNEGDPENLGLGGGRVSRVSFVVVPLSGEGDPESRNLEVAGLRGLLHRSVTA
jgi:hypothetical protein